MMIGPAFQHPDLIREQVMSRRTELQAQGDSLDGDIARAKRNVLDIDTGRDRLLNQLSRGIITEGDFERVMVERNKEKGYWQDEIIRLETLHDDAAKVQSDLEFAYRVLETHQQQLPELDMTHKALRAMSYEEQLTILMRRKRIIRSLCEKVTVWGDGRIVIDGMLDSDKIDELPNHLAVSGS
jgi:hypothetical protein